MKSRQSLKRQFANAALIAVTSAGSALAADLPKEGKYDITVCLSGVSKPIVFSATHSAFSFEQSGATFSNPRDGFLDNGTFYCVGLGTSLGTKISYNTVCEVKLPDGGTMLSTFTRGPDGNVTREMVAGTGKYEGIVAGGMVEPMGTFLPIKPGTFQNCNRQTGTYKLK